MSLDPPTRPGRPRRRPGRAATLLLLAAPAILPAAGDTGEDQALEAFLRTAEIVSMEGLHGGVTMPYRVTLRLDGVERRAVLKTVDLTPEGEVRVGGRAEEGFSDRYQYEIAAYRVDRLLGLGMVPVTVFRNVSAQPGSLQLWVENAVTEEARRAGDLGPDDPSSLERQLGVMAVFDALIGNADRHEGNMLYTGAVWRLHLIDHSRAFRTEADVPAAARRAMAELPEGVITRLRNLAREGLALVLDDLVAPEQVDSLLARRDTLVRALDRRRGAP